MHNVPLIEEYFKKFIKNIHLLSNESYVNIDLQLLHQFGLLDYYKSTSYDPSLTRYFQVLETTEKITLINDEFIVWIVPEKIGNIAHTYTLIALNLPDGPILELVFVNSGIFNTSRLVLRVLEKFLREIEENEKILLKYKTS